MKLEAVDHDELDKYEEVCVDDKICSHCGYSNPCWMTECEMCGTTLRPAKISLKDEDD